MSGDLVVCEGERPKRNSDISNESIYSSKNQLRK